MNREHQQSVKELPVETVVSVIGSKFGLDIIDDPTAMDGGVESAVWLANTDLGKWYIKAYGLHEGSKERIEDEVEYYDFLRGQGILVPEVLASKFGKKVEQLQNQGDTFSVILMKHEDSTQKKPADLSDSEVVNLGKTIARMNRLSRDYPHKERLVEQRSANLPTDFVEVFSSSANLKEFSSEEIVWIKNLLPRVTEYLENIPNFLPLTETVIHGDLALEHIRFLSGGQIYFFDFADRWWGPVAQEVTIMTENFYRPEDITFERWESLRAAFLDGYLTEFPLTPEDLKAIKPLMLKHLIQGARHLDLISEQIGKEVDSKGNRRRYKLAEYLLKD